jgi:hypothetical protein
VEATEGSHRPRLTPPGHTDENAASSPWGTALTAGRRRPGAAQHHAVAAPTTQALGPSVLPFLAQPVVSEAKDAAVADGRPPRRW